MEDEEAQSFLLSGMLVFSDKVITRKDSKRIKEWLMLTKVGQLFEEEKLEAVLQAKKEEKKQVVEKMIRKGFSNTEILDIIDGISKTDVEAIRNEMRK